MMSIMWADAFRWANAALALALVACCGPAIYAAENWGQRLRFLGSCGVGMILCTVTFLARGTPARFSWYAPAVTLTVACLLAGTVLFLLDERRRWRAGTRRRVPE